MGSVHQSLLDRLADRFGHCFDIRRRVNDRESAGFKTRTPWTRPINAEASYALKTGRGSLQFIADVFNVFNTQTVLEYNTFSELRFGVPNPDFGQAGVSGVVAGQQFVTPRQLRIGVRYEF